MAEDAQSKIINDPHIAKILMGVFALQSRKESHISQVTKTAFYLSLKPEEIGASKEYATIRRRFKVLENQKIINKIVPEKKGEFKTHYTINTDNFLKIVLNYLFELPTYSGFTDSSDMKKHIQQFIKNRYVRSTFILFFRTLSFNYLYSFSRSNGTKWPMHVTSITLREMIFLFFNRMIDDKIINASEGLIDKYAPQKDLTAKQKKEIKEKFGGDEDKYYDHLGEVGWGAPFLRINDKKNITDKDFYKLEKADPEKHLFVEFLMSMWRIKTDFTGNQLLNDAAFSFSDALAKIFNAGEAWDKSIGDEFENPESLFDHMPKD